MTDNTEASIKILTGREAMLAKFLRPEIAKARETIAKLGERLGNPAELPSFWLEGADGAFQAAAIVAVYGQVLKALEGPESDATLDSVHKYARDQVARMARHPTRSTSTCQNIMTQETLSAWATLLERIEWIS